MPANNQGEGCHQPLRELSKWQLNCSPKERQPSQTKHTTKIGKTLTNVDSCPVRRGRDVRCSLTIVFSHIIIYFLWHMNFHAFWGQNFPDPWALHTIPGVFWHGASIFLTRAVTLVRGLGVGLLGSFISSPAPAFAARLSLLTAECSRRGRGTRRSCHSVVKCFCTRNMCPISRCPVHPLIAFRKTFFTKLFAKMPPRHWEREHPAPGMTLMEGSVICSKGKWQKGGNTW